MSLENILSQPSTFLLLVAPPAWGKTRLLKELFHNSKKKWIYLCPLRTLANEFFQSQKDQAILVQHHYEVKNKISFWRESSLSCLIITPELWQGSYLHNAKDIIFILDEFHLFYDWGHDFRSKLWEVFLEVANQNHSILALTATLMPSLKQTLQEHLYLGFESSYLLELGNLQFHYPPEKIIYFPSRWRHLFWRRFNYELKKTSGTILIFCAYRSQVDEIYNKYQSQYDCLKCKGGETLIFSEKISTGITPKLIIATIALSHGVNLPTITKVFLAYAVKREDLWLQMAARGGRKGEKFVLFTHDSFQQSLISRLKSIFGIVLKDLFIRWFFGADY